MWQAPVELTTGLLPCSASQRTRWGFVPLHLPTSSEWHFRKALEPACSARCLQTTWTGCAGAPSLRLTGGYRKGYCSLTPGGMFPPQCERGAGNITDPRMYMINISILCLSPSLSCSLLFIQLCWGPRPGLGSEPSAKSEQTAPKSVPLPWLHSSEKAKVPFPGACMAVRVQPVP